MAVTKKTICDGIRIDKNLIASYLKKVQAGTADFSLVEVYYSGPGRRCQSGTCNKKIHNVFVIRDNDTTEEYEVGSECVKKYGKDEKESTTLDQIVKYWLVKLNKATSNTLKRAKREDKVRQNIQTHRERYSFIKAYLEVKPSNFMSSLQRVIENGWDMSQKQIDSIDRIMSETNLDSLQGESDQKYIKDKARMFEILGLIARLDRVNMGMRPNAYPDLREQFNRNGFLSDNQVALLQSYMHTFRRQIEVVTSEEQKMFAEVSRERKEKNKRRRN